MWPNSGEFGGSPGIIWLTARTVIPVRAKFRKAQPSCGKEGFDLADMGFASLRILFNLLGLPFNTPINVLGLNPGVDSTGRGIFVVVRCIIRHH